MKSARRIAILSIVSLVGVVGPMLLLDPLQRLLIFRPTLSESSGFRARISNYEDIWIPVNDSGDRLHAWWATAQADHHPERAPVLLYLHGARWNLTGSASRIAAFQKLGFNVLAIDYRGFGKSTKLLPSERSTVEDALAAWNWMRNRVAEPRRRVIYGHSVGGAIAVDLALRAEDAAALVLEGTFTSVKEMASGMAFLSVLPLDLLLTQKLDTLSKIGAIAMPLFIIHGSSDTVVPADMARQLFEAAPHPKRLLLADGFGHLRPERGVSAQLRRELLALVCPESASVDHC